MKSTGIKILAGILICLMIPVGIVLNSFSKAVSSDKIFDNIKINGTSVENITKSEAEELLKSENAYKNMDVRYNGKSHIYDLEEFGCEFDFKDAIEEAYSVGRSGNFTEDLYSYINHKYLYESKDFDIKNIIPQDIEPKIYDDIKDSIESEPKDASISIGSDIYVTPGEDGVEIDRDAFKQEIYSKIVPKENILVNVPVKAVEPKVKSEDLNRINGIIGSYKTNFSPYVEGRNENIRVAANYINDTVLMPGEEFSYNEKTRLKTAKNGYKNATVIVNGEIEEGLGGGVCQVSSTLYNSVLYSGLDVVQRRPHSIPSNYVNYGRDAVVSDNAIDFKFRNNYDFPIIIKTSVGSSSVTVSIYGNVESVPNIEITSSVISKKVREVKYVEDPTLPKGEEKIKTKGRDEVRSETYVIVDGVKNLVSRDRYPSQTKVILVGTKDENSDKNEKIENDDNLDA